MLLLLVLAVVRVASGALIVYPEVDVLDTTASLTVDGVAVPLAFCPDPPPRALKKKKAALLLLRKEDRGGAVL